MNENIATVVTPQMKIAAMANKTGNQGLLQQQGTTRIIYDALPIDGRQEYRFFDDASQRSFPFNNLTNGGQLDVGESMVVERVNLSIFESAVPPIVDSIEEVDTASYPTIMKGDMSMNLGNSVVMKPISVLNFDPKFNKDAVNNQLFTFEFNTQITILPLINFFFTLRTAGSLNIPDLYLQLTVEGTGSILSPQTTM